MKKTLIIIPVLMMLAFFANAQKKDSSDSKVYDLVGVEKFPSYPGGDQALVSYIAKKVKYPRKALKANIQGKVIISFVVEKDGTVSDVYARKSFFAGDDMGCIEEAIRVVKKLKNFTSGMQKGVPVKVAYSVPINFKIKE